MAFPFTRSIPLPAVALLALALLPAAVRSAAQGEQQPVALARTDATVNASSVELAQSGYEAVARLHDTEAMLIFVRRVVQQEGFVVLDDGRLRGMIPFYDGGCATQSYDALVKELRRGWKTGKCSEPWLAFANESGSRGFLERKDVQGSRRKSWLFRLLHRSEKEDARQQADAKEQGVAVGGVHVGFFAALDNMGYQVVAATKNKREMEFFAHRVLEKEKLRVTNEGAFQGMLRFYDGVCATQSYENLVAEFHRVLKQPKSCFGGPWVEPVQ